MGNRRRYRRILRATEAPVRSRGELPAGTRRAIRDHAARIGRDGALSPDGFGVPVALLRYVEKVARHAHKVTDDDIAALEASGYTEDQIFEATVCAAVGAGMRRLRRGVRALEGAAKDAAPLR